MGTWFVPGWIKPVREGLRQRKAILACQSTGRDAGGSSVSPRSSRATPRLISRSSSDMAPSPVQGPVCRVDINVTLLQDTDPTQVTTKPRITYKCTVDIACVPDAT